MQGSGSLHVHPLLEVSVALQIDSVNAVRRLLPAGFLLGLGEVLLRLPVLACAVRALRQQVAGFRVLGVVRLGLTQYLLQELLRLLDVTLPEGIGAQLITQILLGLLHLRIGDVDHLQCLIGRLIVLGAQESVGKQRTDGRRVLGLGVGTQEIGESRHALAQGRRTLVGAQGIVVHRLLCQLRRQTVTHG